MSIWFNIPEDYDPQPSKEDKEVSCINCLRYGTIERSKLKIPCIDCATKNGFTWMGKRCYGSFHNGPINAKQYARHMYNIYYIQRHDKWCEKAKKNNRKCIQEMIQDIPYELFDEFMELINYSGCLKCKNCK